MMRIVTSGIRNECCRKPDVSQSFFCACDSTNKN